MKVKVTDSLTKSHVSEDSGIISGFIGDVEVTGTIKLPQVEG